MRVFVTGATGFIGKALITELTAHGHEVVGLARSHASAEVLRKVGATVHPGSVKDLESLRCGAADADGVVHLAFTVSPADLAFSRVLGAVLGGSPTALLKRMMDAIGATDRDAIDALGSALQGSGRPLVTTFGTMGLAGAPGERADREGMETDKPNPRSPGHLRAVNEAAVQRWAAKGVRASIIRLAPSVHGEGDKGLVPQLAASARKHGQAIYVGEGANRWCGVHRDDAAALFRLALEKGTAGEVYHGVGDGGLTFREIAETIGRRLGLPVASTTLQEAQRRFGWLAPFTAVDNPVVSGRTQQALGWRPAGPSLAEDLASTAYFES